MGSKSTRSSSREATIARTKMLTDQAEARRQKVKAARMRREQRISQKKQQTYQKEAKAATNAPAIRSEQNFLPVSFAFTLRLCIKNKLIYSRPRISCSSTWLQNLLYAESMHFHKAVSKCLELMYVLFILM